MYCNDESDRKENYIRELAIDIDGVQSRDEIYEHVVNALWDLLQECGSNLLVGGIFAEVDRDEKLFSLRINITNIDTTLVREQNPVTLEQ